MARHAAMLLHRGRKRCARTRRRRINEVPSSRCPLPPSHPHCVSSLLVSFARQPFVCKRRIAQAAFFRRGTELAKRSQNFFPGRAASPYVCLNRRGLLLLAVAVSGVARAVANTEYAVTRFLLNPRPPFISLSLSLFHLRIVLKYPRADISIGYARDVRC